jgi:fermentation-respiration switch protein FrsA (DUF1100 family)
MNALAVALAAVAAAAPAHHGDLVSAHRLDSKAGHMTRVTYRSVDSRGRAATVSGTVLVPSGKPPKGGWPVVSFGHGTTGIADVCAPSRTAAHTTSPIQQQVDGWARHGYAVVRTDYEGLGTPGDHGYLIGAGEGRNMIDIVRAARELDPHIGTQWVAVGHSQGGQAALFAGAQARAGWAPELRLRGVAALAPASHIGELARSVTTLTQPTPLTGYAALIAAGAANGSPAVDLHAIESDQALALDPLVDEECLTDLEKPAAFGTLSPAALFRPGADLTALYGVLDANNPDLTEPEPVQLFQGDDDTTVPRFLTDQLARELRGRHDRLTYTTYPRVDHVGVVAAAGRALLDWTRRRFGP